MVKKSACVFISGKGSNLKNLIFKSRDYNFPINIKLVISNKKSAYGLSYAKRNSIPYFVVDTNLSNYENKILMALRKYKINFICLAGFMKILSPYFLNYFKNKIINIHPSLLPKYKGLNTHKRALEAKEKFSGCTIHYVSKKLDSGKIIAKKKVKIFKKDTLKELEKRVLKEENKFYPIILEKLIRS